MQKPSMVRIACDSKEADEDPIDSCDKNHLALHLLYIILKKILQIFTYSCIKGGIKTELHEKAVHIILQKYFYLLAVT
jgi:hypothetical protein